MKKQVSNLPLNGFTSICEEYQKIIISRDSGQPQKHIAQNVDLNRVTHYRIDDGVIKDDKNKRCDFLLMNEDKFTAYLIELKGSDLKMAVNQLKNTERYLKDALRGYKLKFRIVANKSCTHAIEGVTYKRYKEEKKSALVCKTNKYEEPI